MGCEAVQSSSMKMEVSSFPVMFVTIYMTVHHIPRDNSHNRNSFKPHKRICCLVNQLDLTIEGGSCTLTLTVCTLLI